MATICIDAMNAAGDATYTFGRTSGTRKKSRCSCSISRSLVLHLDGH